MINLKILLYFLEVLHSYLFLYVWNKQINLQQEKLLYKKKIRRSGRNKYRKFY